MPPPHVPTRIFLDHLFFLIALFPILVHGQTVDGAGVPDWTYTVERGTEDKRVEFPIENGCSTPQHFRIASSESFFRFVPPADVVFLAPYSTRALGARITVSKLQPKTNRLKAFLVCLDCKPPMCSRKKSELSIDITVVEPPPRRQEELLGRASDAAGIEAALKKDLRRVAKAFRIRTQNIQPLKGVQPDTGLKANGFVASEALVIIEEAKRETLRALERKELHPLQEYVKRDFPTPKLKLLHVEITRATTPSAPSVFAQLSLPSLYAARASFDTRVLATIESAQEAFENVSSFIASLESDSEQITLTVISEPNEANVELRTVLGELRHATSTNTDIRGFWPGIYDIFVKKDGFRDVVHRAQRLGVPDTVINCTLVTSGTPRNCQFR